LNTEAENLGFEVPDFIREELEDMLGSRYSRGSSWSRAIVRIFGKFKSFYRDQKIGLFIKNPNAS